MPKFNFLNTVNIKGCMSTVLDPRVMPNMVCCLIQNVINQYIGKYIVKYINQYINMAMKKKAKKL